MTALAPGQSSSCALPVLQLFAVNLDEAGFLRDIVSGTFRILRPDGTEEVPSTAIDIADCPAGNRLSTGRYVAPFTVPASPPLGVWTIEWTYKHTDTGNDRTQTIAFEVLGSVSNPLARVYTTVSAMRAAGVTTDQANAGKLRDIIELASSYVEHFTGRFFVPLAKTILVDGNGSRGLLVNEAIVAIANINIILAMFQPSDSLVDPASIRVFNRHLTQGLLDPDDRDNPKVEFFFHDTTPGAVTFLHSFTWTRGKQNIKMEGVWGFTDPDGTPIGRTPLLIEHATKLLVLRNLPDLTDEDAKSDINRAPFVTELRTEDQQIKYGFPKGNIAAAGIFTGDPEIDSILIRYVRPPQIAGT